MTQEFINEACEQALREAELSSCTKRKVGAVITDASGVIVNRGHNFNPKGMRCEDSAGTTYKEVIHAEIAAINRSVNYEGCTIFVTHQPCERCQIVIDKAKLKIHLVEQFMKFDAGKLRYGLIPPEATEELAKVLTYGAKKYKSNNWKKAEDFSRYIDALYRHLEAWRGGQEFDEESGLSHLSHALTNIAFLIWEEKHKVSMDNRSGQNNV